jgi:peptidoglycan/LPS O-acetylase OafA/YrhL
MSERATRMGLRTVDWFLAITTIVGGVALWVGWITMPLSYLHGSPFSNYDVPAALLTFVVGGAALAAALSMQKGLEVGPVASLIAALAIAGFEVVEWTVIGFNPLQLVYLLVAAVIAVLAIRLELRPSGLFRSRGLRWAFRPR